MISDRWEPISPVTGKIDAFQWRAPVETRDQGRADILASRIEELLAIGAPDAAIADEFPDPKSAAATSTSTLAPDDRSADVVMVVKPARSAPSSLSTRATVTTTAPAVKSGGGAMRDAIVAPRTGGKQAESSPAAPAASPAKTESKLFVTPRAPDDPGPDTTVDETVATFPRRPNRVVN